MLSWVGISPVNWLGGKPATVILGLVYGYIPYLILVLYAGLDRIDLSLVEAGRDLGLNRARTSVLTTLIAVPLGVAFALGINRWRGVTPASFNFVMILSFVIPELIFGVAMFFVFTVLFTSVHLGTKAEVIGLVTWNISWPAIIVQARLVTLGRPYEEAAADLGANRLQTMGRVMIPLLAPAIFASAVLVFSGVIDDFVIVDLLSSNAGNTPMSVIIYSTQHGGNGGPALNALGTIMLVMSFVIAIIGQVGYRFLTRGERGSRIEALTTIAGSEG